MILLLCPAVGVFLIGLPPGGFYTEFEMATITLKCNTGNKDNIFHLADKTKLISAAMIDELDNKSQGDTIECNQELATALVNAFPTICEQTA